MKNKENLFISLPFDIQAVISRLERRIFSIKDTTLSYRTLNHYQSIGVIDNLKEKNSSWRKFNGLELLWIKIVIQLRDFGISLDKIIAIKDQLFDKGKIGYIDKAQFINHSFDVEIALAIHHFYDLYLIIFSDFSYTFLDSKNINRSLLDPYLNVPHISIPLTYFIKDIYSNLKSE
jgi:DNA-binding transcriptional MerR regulator